MTHEDISTEVVKFIRQNFLFDENHELGQEQSLLGSGVVDSTGILELIGYLEDTYSLKFKDSELVADNFDSVKRIAEFVQRKKTEG
jgi:acyl carrier protein